MGLSKDQIAQRIAQELRDGWYIHIPGIFVQRIFQGVDYEKRIEQRTVRAKSE